MKNTKVAVAAREDQLVKTYMATNDLIAAGREAGYSGDDDAVRATAYGTLMRVLRKNAVTNVGDIRDVELAKLDAMGSSLWPVAMSDLELIWQWIGKGKDRRPATCEDDHLDVELGGDHLHVDDDGGRQVCYVIPSMAKLEAIEKCLKLMKRRSDYLGLDFSHGLAQRQQDMEAAYGQEVLKLFRDVFSDPRLNLADEQKEAAKVVVMEQYKAAKGAA